MSNTYMYAAIIETKALSLWQHHAEMNRENHPRVSHIDLDGTHESSTKCVLARIYINIGQHMSTGQLHITDIQSMDDL